MYVPGKVVFYREGGRFLRVKQIEPSDEGHASEERKIYFELAVEGTPPADAKFFGFAGCCGGGPGVDPLLTDTDGVRAGACEVTVNPDGSVQSSPVAIFGGVAQDPQAAPDANLLPGENGLDIVEFGPLAEEDGQTLSASYSFESGIFEEGDAPSFLPDTSGALILILGLGAVLASGGS